VALPNQRHHLTVYSSLQLWRATAATTAAAAGTAPAAESAIVMSADLWRFVKGATAALACVVMANKMCRSCQRLHTKLAGYMSEAELSLTGLMMLPVTCIKLIGPHATQLRVGSIKLGMAIHAMPLQPLH